MEREWNENFNLACTVPGPILLCLAVDPNPASSATVQSEMRNDGE